MADESNKDKKKKVKGFKEFDPGNYIDIEPTISEAKVGEVVVSWGRMNPITTGHEKLINRVLNVAKSKNATPAVFLTHSQDKTKNPLSYNDKIKYAEVAFGKIIKRSTAKTIIQLMQQLQKKFKKVTLVVGSDRYKEMDTLLNKYNGKEYKFDEIEVVSAGARDPDAEGVKGMSASKMREYAVSDNIKKFTTGLPSKLKTSAADIMASIKKGMGMSEEYNEDNFIEEDELDEALTRQQRIKRGRQMRRMRVKMKRGREKASRRRANIDVLKRRSRKAARNVIKTRLAGNKRYADMEPAEKERIDKRIEKISKQRIDNLAIKLLPSVKKKERERLQARHNKNESVDLNEMWGAYVTKRPHMLMDKNNKPKFDKRFKMFKPKQVTEMNEFDIEDIVELMESVEKFTETTGKYYTLDEAKADIYHQHMLKALGKSRLPKNHQYTSMVANNGDFVVKDGGGRTAGRIAKGDHNLKEGQLDEAPRRKGAPKMTGDSIAIQRAKDAEHAKAMGRSVKTGRKLPKKTMTSTQRSLASMRGEEVEMDEAHDPKHVKMAVGIASDKRYAGGNMTGAVKQIDKIKKGLSNHPQVRAVLRKQNEGNEQMPKTYKNIIEAATPAMKKAAASIEAYAKKHGGVDKADFMKAAKMLSSGNAGTNFVKFVDDLDTDPREWLITNLAKTMGKQTVEKMFKVKIREEVELDETLSPSEKKLVNQMYDKKGNLTAIGKKVMNHGKKPGDKGYVESLDDRFEAFMAESIDEVLDEDAKMKKQSDDNLKSLHKQFKGQDQKMPSTQHMMKRITKEMKRRNMSESEEAAKLASVANGGVKDKEDTFKNALNRVRNKKSMKDESSCGSLKKRNEEAGAGEEGTAKLVKRLKKDTPNA